MAEASAEKLENTGPAEKERVATEKAVGKYARAVIAKKKRNRAPDRKEDLQCQRSKENSSKGKKKRRVFVCRRTVRVKEKSEVMPTSFLKIQGRETFVGAKDRRKREG